MQLEAQAILNENLQYGRNLVSSDPVLVEMFITYRNGKEISDRRPSVPVWHLRIVETGLGRVRQRIAFSGE